MLVPQFWAEAKEKKIIDGRQVTIRRFGWSDESDSSAQKHARERVAEAMSLVESGEKIRRRDPKVPYNGAEGVPIREEIVSRHRDSVITRNSYGALCINTPDVLFADIDFQYKPSSKFYWISFFIFLAITSIALYMKSWIVFVVLLFLGFAIVSWVAGLIFKMLHLIQGSEEDIAMGRIKKFSEEHPDLHLRIYETPKGYRVLVMHETFNANDREAIEFLQALHSDPICIQMCKNQNCFRARVSPKPWRIDVERLKPRPGVWPIAPERMSDRIDWVKNYEQVSINYASCRFLEKLGADVVDSKAEFIRTL